MYSSSMCSLLLVCFHKSSAVCSLVSMCSSLLMCSTSRLLCRHRVVTHCLLNLNIWKTDIRIWKLKADEKLQSRRKCGEREERVVKLGEHTSSQSSVPPAYQYICSIFSRNSEANASEFLENMEYMFLRCYTYIVV